MVIIVLWVSVGQFLGTLRVGLILSKLAQPWRECVSEAGSSQARSECWPVHSPKGRGEMESEWLGLLARWIAVLRGPFKVNHLAILWVGRRYSHLCSTWNEIQATYWSEICSSLFERWPSVARGGLPNSRGWGGKWSKNITDSRLDWLGFKFSRPKFSSVTALSSRTGYKPHVPW